MQPRLKTSKKWTAFPREYAAQIEEVFRRSFSGKIGDQTLVIEGRIYSEEVMLRVGLHSGGRLRQANFEVSMSYSPKEADAVERIHNCVDAAASMMMDYLESDGEVDFPLTWKGYPFQERTIYLQFSTVNTELEAQADALLGRDATPLVQEDHETEDALDRAEVMDSDDDDDEASEGSGPRMFGGPRKDTKKPAKGKPKKPDMH